MKKPRPCRACHQRMASVLLQSAGAVDVYQIRLLGVGYSPQHAGVGTRGLPSGSVHMSHQSSGYIPASRISSISSCICPVLRVHGNKLCFQIGNTFVSRRARCDEERTYTAETGPAGEGRAGGHHRQAALQKFVRSCTGQQLPGFSRSSSS